jgi:hypothetical protein
VKCVSTSAPYDTLTIFACPNDGQQRSRRLHTINESQPTLSEDLCFPEDIGVRDQISSFGTAVAVSRSTVLAYTISMHTSLVASASSQLLNGPGTLLC